jgi:hypothetical protein
MSKMDYPSTNEPRFARDHDAERRTAISSAEAIMHDVLGYMPDEPGDARIIRERILKWLTLDAVRWAGSRR